MAASDDDDDDDKNMSFEIFALPALDAKHKYLLTSYTIERK